MALILIGTRTFGQIKHWKSLKDEEIPVRVTAVTYISKVKNIMGKFSSKYGDVRKYYSKPDVAVEVPLWQILL